MNYKDKFNAQMKKAGINSLDDLKTDAEKKAFFKAVDKSHDAKNESLTEELVAIAEGMKEGGPGSGPQMKPGAGTRAGSAKDGGQTDDEADEYDSQMMGEMMKEMASEMKMLKAETDPTKVEMMKKEMMMKAMKKMPEMSEMMKKEMMKKMNEYGSMNAMKEEMKTGDDDMTPDALKLNAMVKDPHKSSEENPKKDLNAKYMKSDVRADVKNGGGADMSKVQDAPKMMTAMKKINAMYNTEKYLESKSGSLNDVLAQMHLNEQKSVSIKVQEFSELVETYLAKGGVLGNISEAVREVELNKSLRMVEVREFITTYNLHFLTNYAAEEFILTEKKAGYIDIKFNSSFEAKRMMTWLDKNISPVNNQLYDGAYREGQSIIQFEDVPNVDALMKKLKSARINFKVDTMKEEIMNEAFEFALTVRPFHTSARIKTDKNTARRIKSFLADNGERYPVAIDDNDSGQITLDDDGEKGASYEAGMAIKKKFNVQVMGSK